MTTGAGEWRARRVRARPRAPRSGWRGGGGVRVFKRMNLGPAGSAATEWWHTQGCIQRGKDIAVSDGGLSDQPALADSGPMKAEELRLRETRAGVGWRAWGPYLSERQWGTIREDYCDGGDAWSYFTHDQTRSRAYRR